MPSTIEETRTNLKAKKFLIWLLVISSFMLFAALTSGFIVYTAGNVERGIKILLPQAFVYSTAAIIVSSLTMHMAYLSGKRLQFGKQKAYLLITILLGLIFFALQLSSWKYLITQGVYFVNPNASQSFLYIFTGAHLVHVFAGILMLFTAWLGKVKNIPQMNNLFRLEITSIFWHFIDILWIYLYVFLLLNQ
ncbi:MAG: heme-copper oxidase subunit III [Sphingobacteriaceae bacterium]